VEARSDLKGRSEVSSIILPASVDEPNPVTEDPTSTETTDNLASIWRLDAPVAVVMDFVGVTLNQYDQLISALDLSPGGSALPGCLFHWASRTRDGVRATEVWRNIKLFDFFLREEVLPTVSALRVPDPEISVYAVHHFLSEGKFVKW
jgi:hypothetical protein